MTMATDNGVAHRWAAKLRTYLPGYFAARADLAPLFAGASLCLHGSTAAGLEDPFSDLDLWLLLEDGTLKRLDEVSPTRFFSIELDGKPGHLNGHSVSDFTRRLAGCDLQLIFELRQAHVIFDGTGQGGGLVEQARRPMRPEVSRAFFFYHYVEMRGLHRNADNPMERGDEAATLVAATQTVVEAMRAAMVLDGQPYPYEKWLPQACRGTQTGQKVLAHVLAILDLLGEGALRFRGREADHPIGQKLRAIRHVLVEAAQAKGIQDPWLEKWWLFMDQAADAPRRVQW
jgi:hypothetical protein